ncbi:hypothetical protein SBRY_60115 [Actinacidiphila bryophytorum]|uniref:Uncharacterized protein n=1 Tax=Actinacidiphila bryophytorum TaxID=1436133 RepID=A0A9W4H5A7_9ACTN|nr:hypothetical protein SBRY_60115 [Actinacidiphila bryophytorum]
MYVLLRGDPRCPWGVRGATLQEVAHGAAATCVICGAGLRRRAGNGPRKSRGSTVDTPAAAVSY